MMRLSLVYQTWLRASALLLIVRGMPCAQLRRQYCRLSTGHAETNEGGALRPSRLCAVDDEYLPDKVIYNEVGVQGA